MKKLAYHCEWTKKYNIGEKIHLTFFTLDSPEKASAWFSTNKCEAFSKEEFEKICLTFQTKIETIIKNGKFYTITYALIYCFGGIINNESRIFIVTDIFKIWTVIDSPPCLGKIIDDSKYIRVRVTC